MPTVNLQRDLLNELAEKLIYLNPPHPVQYLHYDPIDSDQCQLVRRFMMVSRGCRDAALLHFSKMEGLRFRTDYGEVQFYRKAYVDSEAKADYIDDSHFLDFLIQNCRLGAKTITARLKDEHGQAKLEALREALKAPVDNQIRCLTRLIHYPVKPFALLEYGPDYEAERGSNYALELGVVRIYFLDSSSYNYLAQALALNAKHVSLCIYDYCYNPFLKGEKMPTPRAEKTESILIDYDYRFPYYDYEKPENKFPADYWISFISFILGACPNASVLKLTLPSHQFESNSYSREMSPAKRLLDVLRDTLNGLRDEILPTLMLSFSTFIDIELRFFLEETYFKGLPSFADHEVLQMGESGPQSEGTKEVRRLLHLQSDCGGKGTAKLSFAIIEAEDPYADYDDQINAHDCIDYDSDTGWFP